MTTTESVIRYVVTHLSKGGSRVLTWPRQGRFSFASEEEAQLNIDLYKKELRRAVLGDRADTLEVRPVECWPNHYDPKTCWFD